VRLAGPEHHARDQDADARTGFHCSERRHRIFEPNNFKESRAQRCHGKVTPTITAAGMAQTSS